MDVIYKEYDNTIQKENLIAFFEANDRCFPDPFSNHVLISDYVNKLIKFSCICIALADKQIVGLSCAYMNDSESKIAHWVMLLVSPDYQGYHIGYNLSLYTIDKAQESGMKKIVLTVDSCNNRAKALYSSIGYVFFEDVLDKRANKLHMAYDLIHQTKRVQKRLLEMGKIITRILDTNKIPHFIAFGTLLGAVRHKGFIPWDDDFDLFLFDDTYDKALHCLKEELPRDMFLEYFDSEPLYFHAWAHIKDVNTTTVCQQFAQDGIYKHKGLSVDLYKLSKMKLSDVDDYRHEEYVEYLKRKFKSGLIDEREFNNLVNKIKAHHSNEKKDVTDQDVYGMVVEEKYVTCDEVLPLKKYLFEDTQFWGPNDPDSILRRFYGEYMVLPEEKDRTPHYGLVKFSNAK